MKNKRRIHTAEFKARIALEAVKGLKTVQQIAEENEVHPTQVTQWKSQMIAGACEVFEQGLGGWRNLVLPSVWTDAVAGWTRCSLRGCGGA
jgi:hypothetical protein